MSPGGEPVWRNFCNHGEWKEFNLTSIPVEPPC
jgi:hypothetical protein